MDIRLYQARDAQPLTQIRRELGRPGTAVDLHRYFSRLQKLGGRVWVGVANGRFVGYVVIVPLPGLPHLLQLGGGVAKAQQRRGFGSELLHKVLGELEGSGKTLSHGISTLDSPAALFLQQHQFGVGHEEWQMRLKEMPPANLPKAQEQLNLLAAEPSLRTLPRPQAIQQFIKLYDQSFEQHPWYQPYTPEDVDSDLDDARDIRFLVVNGQPVGFLWQQQQGKTAEIEPVGIVPAAQGRGYGRWLLQTAVSEAAQQGITEIELGVWRSNEAAVHLYKSMGFVHVETQYYLERYVD